MRVGAEADKGAQDTESRCAFDDLCRLLPAPCGVAAAVSKEARSRRGVLISGGSLMLDDPSSPDRRALRCAGSWCSDRRPWVRNDWSDNENFPDRTCESGGERSLAARRAYAAVFAGAASDGVSRYASCTWARLWPGVRRTCGPSVRCGGSVCVIRCHSSSSPSMSSSSSEHILPTMTNRHASNIAQPASARRSESSASAIMRPVGTPASRTGALEGGSFL